MLIVSDSLAGFELANFDRAVIEGAHLSRDDLAVVQWDALLLVQQNPLHLVQDPLLLESLRLHLRGFPLQAHVKFTTYNYS